MIIIYIVYHDNIYLAAIIMFQMLTCLSCGHEWKSNLNSTRPQCSECKSTKNIPSEDIPPHLKFKKELDKINEEIADLRSTVNQFISVHEDQHEHQTSFELQVTHSIKDLTFWTGVLKERTKPPHTKPQLTSEGGLRSVRRPAPINKTPTVSNRTARPAGY